MEGIDRLGRKRYPSAPIEGIVPDLLLLLEIPGHAPSEVFVEDSLAAQIREATSRVGEEPLVRLRGQRWTEEGPMHHTLEVHIRPVSEWEARHVPE